MQDQFQRLKETVLKAKIIYWSDDLEDEYSGPVNPSAIVSMTVFGINKSNKYLVLAERVPATYISWDAQEFPLGIVLAALDDNFELKRWDSKNMILQEIQGCLCTHGTIEGNNLDGVNSEGKQVYMWSTIYKPSTALSNVSNINQIIKGETK